MVTTILAADIGMTNIDLAIKTSEGVSLKMLTNPHSERGGSSSAGYPHSRRIGAGGGYRCDRGTLP